MYVKVDVSKPGDNKGVGGDKKATVTIFDWDDVASMPARNASGIVITGNITLNAGAYMSKLYATQSTIKAGADSEGDPDAKGIMQSVEFEHPGDSQAIREFRANWMNKNIGIIIERCSSVQKNQYGTPCSPLQMVFKAEDDKDKNKTTFTFKSINKGPDVADYQGTMTYSTVLATIAADAATVNLVTGSGRYALTSGVAAAATITTCSNAVDGMSFTLVGSGGAFPSEITGDDFVLSSGTAWTAIAGAEITFKAFKSGASAWKFFELSRK
ncbi:MAG: hypothetical protein WCK09_00305 [Bacteroidota bacterium]